MSFLWRWQIFYANFLCKCCATHIRATCLGLWMEFETFECVLRGEFDVEGKYGPIDDWWRMRHWCIILVRSFWRRNRISVISGEMRMSQAAIVDIVDRFWFLSWKKLPIRRNRKRSTWIRSGCWLSDIPVKWPFLRKFLSLTFFLSVFSDGSATKYSALSRCLFRWSYKSWLTIAFIETSISIRNYQFQEDSVCFEIQIKSVKSNRANCP